MNSGSVDYYVKLCTFRVIIFIPSIEIRVNMPNNLYKLIIIL